MTPRQLPLPIAPSDFDQLILSPAAALLPDAMDTPPARVLLTAIALQESRLAHRWQIVDPQRPEKMGPARGLLQFERGGGCAGVGTQPASRYWMHRVCAARDVEPTPRDLWNALEHDDVLAAAAGRLLLFTDPKRLPDVGEERAAWLYYLRVWRPGKPRPKKWPENYRRACDAVAAVEA
jgi:hypothetical protein